MFASSIDALDRHRRLRQDVRHVQRVRVAGHHVRPDGVAGREAPEDVAHRPDDVRLRLAQHRVLRQLRDVRARAATRASRRRCSSIQRASASASPASWQTKHDARVIRSATTYVRKPPDSATAFAPRCTRRGQAALGVRERDDDLLVARGPSRRRRRPPTARTRRARPASCATETGIDGRRRSPTPPPSRTARGRPVAPSRPSASWRASIDAGVVLAGKPRHRAEYAVRTARLPG